MIVIFEPLMPNVTPPMPATKGSAGYDVRAYLKDRLITFAGGRTSACTEPGYSLTLAPGERAIIPLGFRAQLPEGCEAQLRIRSSIALHRGLIIPNAPATIDPDYPNEWVVLIGNVGHEPAQLVHGERFAQIVFARFLEPTWEPGVVSPTSERIGGVGSTGLS